MPLVLQSPVIGPVIVPGMPGTEVNRMVVAEADDEHPNEFVTVTVKVTPELVAIVCVVAPVDQR